MNGMFLLIGLFVLVDTVCYCYAAHPESLEETMHRYSSRKDFWIPGAGIFAVYRHGWRK